jgi:glycosyltransferase involved in cell wall biosynthesis
VTVVHVVVPDVIDDPARPSGGNTYDRRICRGLAALAWSVREHAVPGGWPRPDAAALAALAAALNSVPDGSVVLVDGLVGSTAPEILVPHARRVHVVVLVHMPLGDLSPKDRDARVRESAVLSAAAAVVATSAWTRARILELYRLSSDSVHVAPPGVDSADLAPGTGTDAALLSVAAVTFDKGHDVLLDALVKISDLAWRCLCVGSLDRDPVFVESLRQRAQKAGLHDRIEFPGPRTGAELDRSYASADLMVLASRAETYGMVVTEALARGLPVIAADVGGLTEALGYCADGTRPGLLVPPDDPAALESALRRWLGSDDLRGRLRRAARERRESLPGWSTTTSLIAGLVDGLTE